MKLKALGVWGTNVNSGQLPGYYWPDCYCGIDEIMRFSRTENEGIDEKKEFDDLKS